MFTYKKTPYKIFTLGPKFCWPGPAKFKNKVSYLWTKLSLQRRKPKAKDGAFYNNIADKMSIFGLKEDVTLWLFSFL